MFFDFVDIVEQYELKHFSELRNIGNMYRAH